MYVIPKFLYDDLSYTTYSGIRNTLVNNTVVPLKINLPKVDWELKIEFADWKVKNAIEESLQLHANELYLPSAVGPGFMLFRRDSITSGTEYFLTYYFEFKYYGVPVNRPISYTVEGNTHVLDGGMRVPSAFAPGDSLVIFEHTGEIHRKVLFTGPVTKVTHKANGLYNFSLKLQDIASPVYDDTAFQVGVSNADYVTVC
jgi:hypothetical protein